MSLAVGVDIGGTKIAFALIDERGCVLATHREPTVPDEGVDSVLDRMADGINSLLLVADDPVAGVGIGSPGHVDVHHGIVRNAVNLGWREVNVRECVQSRLSADLPVWIAKDANAAAIGEMYFGVAQGCDDHIYLAVGTGLGGGAVVKGEIVLGAASYAMEIGHFSLNPVGRLCACGLRGCPEMYASGIGMLTGAREYLPEYPDSALAGLSELTTTAILDAARLGDRLALHVIADMAECLSTVTMMCASALNPALCVIGGGLGHAAADLLIPDVKQRLERRLLPGTFRALDVVESHVQNSAIGAACLVWHAMRDGI